MGASIRTIVRRTLESPAGGLVTTALAWAVVCRGSRTAAGTQAIPDRPAVAGGCQPWRLGPVRRGVTDPASPRRALPARSWRRYAWPGRDDPPRPGAGRLRAAAGGAGPQTASRVASLVRMAPTARVRAGEAVELAAGQCKLTLTAGGLVAVALPAR